MSVAPPAPDASEDALLDAPPIPFRTQPLPRQPRHAQPRVVVSRAVPERVEPAPETHEESAAPVPVVRRARVPDPIPVGTFNPGFAIAWTVALGMSGVVLLWYAGPAFVMGL